jgi:effector-binding domain-containing protein
MSVEESGTVVKRVGDMLIASIRYRGAYEECVVHFEKLMEEAKDRICGDAFCLYTDNSGEGGHDIECCFPVSEPVETDAIRSRTLEGGEMLSIVHHGPYDEVYKSWQKLGGFARSNRQWGTRPRREIYREYSPDNPEKHVTELQVPLVVMGWLDRLVSSLKRHTEDSIGKQVMEGSDTLSAGTPAEEKAAWVRGAMERLDELVDEETGKKVMRDSACVFPEVKISLMREMYEKTGDIDELLEEMREDRRRGASYPYPPFERVDEKILRVTKVPCVSDEYEKAEDARSRRRCYCHCPWVFATDEDISTTYCHCGAGYFKQLWEGILGKPVEVEFVESVISGGDGCRFVIHLPI